MNSSKKATLGLIIVTVMAFAAVATVLGLGVILNSGTSGAVGTASGTVLPLDCVRPANGFLIIVSKFGYNDSILEGAGPTKAWPVVSVEEGQTVKITVCNVDTLAHGFQVANYVDSITNVIAPGKALSVSFVADKEGTFTIYCAIFCPIHFLLQYGQLRVAA